jgi:hypothetical protein
MCAKILAALILAVGGAATGIVMVDIAADGTPLDQVPNWIFGLGALWGVVVFVGLFIFDQVVVRRPEQELRND